MRRITLPFVLLAFMAVPACKKGGSAAKHASEQSLEARLLPGAMVSALRAKGGGHYHATATFRLAATAAPTPDTVPASKDTITTTTDVWVDGKGDFRLVETNDNDGGREVARVGAEAVVAMRYEKGVRRPMLPAEADAILAEAVGAPYAAWDVLSGYMVATSSVPDSFVIQRAEKPIPTGKPASKLRAWRETIVVDSAQGAAKADGGLVTNFKLRGTYKASREGTPLAGDVTVTAAIDELGKVPSVVLPDVPPMPTRQRTTLDERALLGGLQGFHGTTKSR